MESGTILDGKPETAARELSKVDDLSSLRHSFRSTALANLKKKILNACFPLNARKVICVTALKEYPCFV